MQGAEVIEQQLEMGVVCVLKLFLDCQVQDALAQAVCSLYLFVYGGLSVQGCQHRIPEELVLPSHQIVLAFKPSFRQFGGIVEISFHLSSTTSQNNINYPKMKIILATLLALSWVSQSLAKMIWIADVASPGAHYPLNDLYDGKETASQRGQLNGVGMRQQYLLGTYLRADYIDKEGLISQKFNPNYLEVFSCQVDRSMDSALSRAFGLFPPGTGWTIPSEVTDPEMLKPPFNSSYSLDKKLSLRRLSSSSDQDFALRYGFQPVPVYGLKDVLDDACPNEGKLRTVRYKEIGKNISSFLAFQSIFVAKMKVVFNLSALQISLPTLCDLYDTLVSDLTLGRELPTDFDQDFDLKSLKYISDYYTTLLYDGSYGENLSVLLLAAIKDKMDLARLHRIGDKRWSMFFGKEATVSPLMTTLNLTSANCLAQQFRNQTVTDLNCMDPPSMSSNLIIELHQDDAFEHSIRIKYNGHYANLCEKNSTWCEYQSFWARISIDTDAYHKACYDK